MKPFVAALVLLLQAAPTLSPQSAKASIAGVVVAADTGAPVPGARVTLMRFVRVSNEFAGAEPAASSETDRLGKFAFTDLDAGAYVVQVDANGYIALTDRYMPPASGQRSSRAAMIPLPAGGSVTDVEFRATPVGIVGGRIVDTSGRPLAGMSVELFRKTYDESGGESFGSGGATTTNERGEYRVPAMPRAGYYLFARMFYRAGGADPIERYAGSLYPGTGDFAAASTIDVGARSTVMLKDLALGRQQLYAIRGRVVDSATGRPPADASVWITTTSLLGAETITATPTYNPADGTFETRVGPARYAVGVTLLNPPRLAPPTAANGLPVLPPVAREALVTVSNADVEGIVLTLVTPSVSVRGRLSVDGGPVSSAAGWENVRVQLNASRDGVVRFVGPQVLPQNLPAMADGTFQLFGMMFGEFRLRVTGLPADAYVKEARIGAADALNQPLQISTSTPDTLEITLSSQGGRIEGAVVSDTRQPVANAQVVLVPNTRERVDLFHVVAADDRGRFAFRGVAPGGYKVFAWTTLEPFAYFDPTLLRRFENDAVAVRVTEASSLNVTVQVIPRN